MNEDLNSPEGQDGPDDLHRLSLESARTIMNGLLEKSDQAAQQLVGLVHFLISIGTAFGAKFSYVEDPSGVLDVDGNPVRLIVMTDSITGDRIDSNDIRERINVMIQIARKELEKQQEHYNDNLTEDDL